MNVLVTGATGFLGSYIVEKCLAQGDRVRALVRSGSDMSFLKTLPNVEIVVGDISDKNSLLRALKSVEVVYHSAGRVTDNGSREQFYTANVVGTQNLLNAAKANGAERFVFIGSPSAVMDMKDHDNIDESYPYPEKFVNFYSETKAISEQLVLAENNRNFVTCSLRPRAVWGPRDKNGFLPRILAKMLAGSLRDFSGGKKVMASLCYCENAAEACLLASKSERVGGKIYFITDGKSVDICEFSKELSRIFGLPRVSKKLNPQVAMALATTVEALWKLPFLQKHYSPPLSKYAVGLLTLSSTFDISAARRDLNYSPKIDTNTGLSLFKNWVDEVGGVNTFRK